MDEDVEICEDVGICRALAIPHHPPILDSVIHPADWVLGANCRRISSRRTSDNRAAKPMQIVFFNPKGVAIMDSLPLEASFTAVYFLDGGILLFANQYV
jgi:hypothetical protein